MKNKQKKTIDRRDASDDSLSRLVGGDVAVSLVVAPVEFLALAVAVADGAASAALERRLGPAARRTRILVAEAALAVDALTGFHLANVINRVASSFDTTKLSRATTRSMPRKGLQ